ncbi:MAG: hypothetical protein JXB48_11075 [Candidatus Latescibacteria bacterium]|nr:hypothetical protein [Candidatus Latescibacterota bacterium]
MYPKITVVFLMSFFVSVYSDNPDNGQQETINDGDKTSSRISDMITTVEQAKKAMDVAQGAKEAVDLIKNLKNINLKEMALQKLKETVVQYKNTKQSFIQFVSGITDKTTEVLDKASNRVNMWRTTQPTLMAFGDGLKLMADNTVKVFQEFEPKDLIDIDRKWERSVEDQLMADKRFVLGCIYFLDYSSSVKARQSFNSLFLDDGLKEHMTRTPLGIRATVSQMTRPVHTYRKIPSVALNHASEAIEATGKITSSSHDKSPLNPSISIEQQDFGKIQQTLVDEDQTYEDARELSAFISLKRQTISTQTTQLQQVYAMLQADLARLYLNDREIVALQSEQVSNSLKIISHGKPLPAIADQIQRRN